MNDAELARLLRALPPAPDAWVQAAVELPRMRALLGDPVFLAAASQDPAGALRAAGVEPDARRLAEVRDALGLS